MMAARGGQLEVSRLKRSLQISRIGHNLARNVCMHVCLYVCLYVMYVCLYFLKIMQILGLSFFTHIYSLSSTYNNVDLIFVRVLLLPSEKQIYMFMSSFIISFRLF